MPIEIQALDQVPESELKKIIKNFAQPVIGANIVTAINDGNDTFSVEATFIDPGPQGSITRHGTMSTFGGPHDLGVSPSEGLALYSAADIGAAPAGLFLAAQPPGTTGLARRLNEDAIYLACRWDYSVTPRDFLRGITVKVSVDGKPPVEAHPVDWGPNIATGRVADLSPGLAHALHLDTDDFCNLEIPLPAAVAIPVAAGQLAVGIDLAAIDDLTFPADMTRSLVVMTTFSNVTHWVVTLVGKNKNEGGQTLMRKVGGNPPELLRSDTVILPIKADAQISASVAAELNKAIQKEPETPTHPAGPAPGAGDDINAKIFAAAQAFVGHVTSNVKDTNGGRLACAWSVNEVTRIALGKPISSDGGKNGLSTIGIFDVLKARHTKLNSASDATAGSIIIAPTVGKQHGHVGIVGDSNKVFSNKSIPGVFAQNFTIQKFTSSYTGKGLQVLFFNLNGDQFV
jgi:hypothetical protein